MAETTQSPVEDIWAFNRTLSSRSLQINLVNMWVGRKLSKHGDFWRGVGSQAVGWGFISVAIALVGNQISRNKMDSIDYPASQEAQLKETKSLRRILRINTPLNFVYMWIGHQIAKRSKENEFRNGMGWGIVLQGLLLLAFDSFHLRQVSELYRRKKSDRAD